jgi:hypothetical protein
MQTRRSARLAAEAEAEAASRAGSALYHAVLFSPDLSLELWPSLDRTSKVALRCVSRAMRSQVDASIEVVASPSSGFTAAELTAVLLRWPSVRDLTLLAVSGAELAPLATASVAGLTSLTVRQVGRMGAWHAHADPSHACSSCVESGRLPAMHPA